MFQFCYLLSAGAREMQERPKRRKRDPRETKRAQEDPDRASREREPKEMKKSLAKETPEAKER